MDGSESGSEAGRFRPKDAASGPTDEELETHHVTLTNELIPKIDSKFWA